MKKTRYKNDNYELHKKQRKTWEINPKSRVVPNADKGLSKKEIAQLIEESEQINNDMYFSSEYSNGLEDYNEEI